MDTSSPEAWYKSLPKLTKILTTGTFVVTVLFALKLLDPLILTLDWQLVTKKFQIWRLVTDYFFVGKFSFSWLFQMYFLVTFSSKLEQNEIFTSSTPGSYLYFLLLQIMALNLASLVLYWPSGRYLMGPSLHFAILYYWSKRDPYSQVGLWGFNLQGYQVPFAMIVMGVLMGGSIWTDLMGLFTGHLYYFLRELLPEKHNVDLISKCPAFLDDAMVKLERFSLSGSFSTTSRPAATRSTGTTPSAGSSSSFGTSGPYGGGGSAGGGGSSSSGGSSSGRYGVSEFSGTGYRLGRD